MKELSAKERILRQIRGQEVDHIPTLGGWIGGAHVLANIANIPLKEYLADPTRGVVRAHKALDIDGMVNPAVHTSADQVRTGEVIEAKFSGIEPEAIQQKAESLPDSEKVILDGIDLQAKEQEYRTYFETAFRDWDGIVPIPNFWELGGPFPLYTEFGYTAFFLACVLYPQAVEKLWWARSVPAREYAKIMAKLYQEYDLVPLMFCGEDLCNNKGPMVSPALLRQSYLPLVKMIIAPLVESGIRLIHHCDGDVRPLVKDYIEIGFSGLQGFQYELGLDLHEFASLRSCLGEELLFFTGLSVSRTLPFGTPEEVRKEVDYFLDFTGGGKGMFLFTSNVTGVEVPPENLQAAYRYIRELTPHARKPACLQRDWTWDGYTQGHWEVSARSC